MSGDTRHRQPVGTAIVPEALEKGSGVIHPETLLRPAGGRTETRGHRKRTSDSNALTAGSIVRGTRQLFLSKP